MAPGSALASYKASVQAGTLQIVGDSASDKLALLVDPGSPNTLLVDVGEDGTADLRFDRSTFTAIDVQAGRGDDDVRIGAGLADKTITVDGGAGDDTLTGGDGSETFIGGSGNDTIDGGRGNDVAHLGAGKDTFIWSPGDGSDTVEGIW